MATPAEEHAKAFEESRNAKSQTETVTEEEVTDEEELDETPETDEENPEEEVESEDDSEDEEEDDEEDLPENIRNILDKNRKDLKQERTDKRKAIARAKKAEQELKDLREGNDTEVDPKDNPYYGLYLKSQVTNALTKAGAVRVNERTLRNIDLDELDIDDNGDVTGLAEQIEDLKNDLPELFADPTKQRKTKATADSAGRRTAPAKKPNPYQEYEAMINRA